MSSPSSSPHQTTDLDNNNNNNNNNKPNPSPIPTTPSSYDVGTTEAQVAPMSKGWWKRMGPSIACGAGLFSDGYVNCVIGSVSTVLERKYEDEYKDNPIIDAIRSSALAGTLVGQLGFGYLSDKWSRQKSLAATTYVLIVATALCAGAWWRDGNVNAMLVMLAVFRFFAGVGIGGEYPAGSVSCAESQGEVKQGTRNRWFIIFTNAMIDIGFVIGSIVPTIIARLAPDNYDLIWRLSMAVGCVFPIFILFLRRRLEEPEEFKKNSMKKVKIPYGLVFRLYGKRLLAVGAIWFIYDVSSYSFSIYSSKMLELIHGNDAPLWVMFAWTIVIHSFYMPGAIAGAFLSDKLGPRYTLALGTVLQGTLAMVMAAVVKYLIQPHMVPLFVTIYGIFMAFGEMGPGDNIGLVASKTCATGIRGQYYGVAAAVGKLGACAGIFIFKAVQAAAKGDEIKELQYPFWLAGSLCFVSATLAAFCLPKIDQTTVENEDERFRAYLESKGFDTSGMGTLDLEDHAVKQ